MIANNKPQHKSDLIMWSLQPMDDHVVLFEAGIKTDKKDGNLWATFNDGSRYAYHLLRVWIIWN